MCGRLWGHHADQRLHVCRWRRLLDGRHVVQEQRPEKLHDSGILKRLDVLRARGQLCHCLDKVYARALVVFKDLEHRAHGCGSKRNRRDRLFCFGGWGWEGEREKGGGDRGTPACNRGKMVSKKRNINELIEVRNGFLAVERPPECLQEARS